ncbi:histidine kinase [Streptomyces sp. NPDC002057]|uniref:sensor histidine kinase n=1 Tax=Streptomyces sp. NPDC002057 TaxID=3154664 RepID=UPI00332DFFD9
MTAPAPRRVLGDLALWAALCGAHVVWFRGDATPSVVRDLVLPLLVATVAVPLARHRPTGAVALAGALCAVGLADATSPAHVSVLTLGAASCLLGVRAAGARTPLLVLAGCLAAALAVCAVLRAGPVWWFYTLTVLPTALLLPWLAGRYWRGRTELVSGGWRLARSLEERQRFVAERARLTERADIAADMHDSLGHVLSLVALRAGALELSPTLDARDREDLAELRRTIADAVDHLRETVTVLRTEPGSESESGWGSGSGSGSGSDAGSGRDTDTGTDEGTGAGASPGADADALLPAAVAPADTVEALLGRAVAAGVPVRWEREGPPPTLSPLIERGVYRVVREALTNATKHAPGSTVRVRIAHDRDHDRTHVRIVNALPVPGPSPTPPGGGHGLAGLRERVTVLGGTLRTGPYEDGFHVSATLPHRATPPHRAEAPGDGGSASEAVRRLAQVRRSARRRLAAAFAVPAGAALFFVPAAVFLAYQLSTGVLPPSAYEELRVGRTRAELAGLLPARPFPYPPDGARSAHRPPGTECGFYRSNGNLLAEVDLYRLCWSGTRLAAKDVLRP